MATFNQRQISALVMAQAVEVDSAGPKRASIRIQTTYWMKKYRRYTC